jgi:hypothetical protein
MCFVNLNLMAGLRKVESVLSVTWELNIQILFETKFWLNTVRWFVFDVSPRWYRTYMIVPVTNYPRWKY